MECLHPVPWLIGSWMLAAHALWLPAAGRSFMFFLTALHLNHEAIHRHLGFGARGHYRVTHVLSAVMLDSNHAVAFNHLQHHAHLGTPRDIEGKAGRMSGRRVLLYGALFPIEMHLHAWRKGGTAMRRRMRINLAANVATVVAAVALGSSVLLYHLVMMIAAQCLTAFAVWITHHDLDADHDLAARTSAHRWSTVSLTTCSSTSSTASSPPSPSDTSPGWTARPRRLPRMPGACCGIAQRRTVPGPMKRVCATT